MNYGIHIESEGRDGNNTECFAISLRPTDLVSSDIFVCEVSVYLYGDGDLEVGSPQTLKEAAETVARRLARVLKD